MISKKINRNEELNKKSLNNLAIKELPINTWIIQGDYKFLKPLNDYDSISNDLDYVIDCLRELKLTRFKEQNGEKFSIIFKRSLFVISIITYARCFTSTKGNGRRWLDKNIIKKYYQDDKEDIKSSDLLRFHDYIINLRKKFIAHADENQYETNQAYINFSFNKESMILNSEFNSYNGAMYNFDEIQMQNFEILGTIFKIIINDKIKLTTNKLKDEIGNKKLMEIGLPLSQKLKK